MPIHKNVYIAKEEDIKFKNRLYSKINKKVLLNSKVVKNEKTYGKLNNNKNNAD